MAGAQNSNHPKIQRVPPLLLDDEKNKKDYYPKVVSIGPYHHGKEALKSVEAFKPKAVDLFTSGDGRQDKEFYYNNVLDIIHQVRNCYEQDPKCSDPDLAQMMLRDASLIIIYMEMIAPGEKQLLDTPTLQRKASAMISSLGRLTVANLLRDFFLLENQIPLCVIKLLIKLRHGEGEDQKLLDRYMNTTIYGENREKRESPPQGAEPLHLLEAFHRLVVSDCVKKTSCVCFKCRWFCCAPPPPTGGGGAASPTYCTCTFLCCSRVKKEKRFDPEIGVGPAITYANRGLIHRLIMLLACKKGGAAKANNSKNSVKKLIHSFRTVTDLKAKGIYFAPSPTQSLKDVNFKSQVIYARLELPEWAVSISTKVFFLNLVAYELSPDNPGAAEVSSYISLMKSLIERPEDVKELRERRIFYNTLGSDEEVLSVYRDINTYGVDNRQIFKNVKSEIQAHYNSRMKTWLAELIHTNFRSPWTVTAFVAALAALAISAAQLYYAVHPNS